MKKIQLFFIALSLLFVNVITAAEPENFIPTQSTAIFRFNAQMLMNTVMSQDPTGMSDHAEDVHALAEGLRLVLCGVEIEHTKGCVAHSDGDVAIHAICDSLLGALALGDIGKLFPDSDQQYKGIDSRKLLKHVVDIVAAKGYSISNIDCTIAMQRPKLRPHIDTMRERLAEVVGIDVERISVKATTTERLGFEGREEGVSATAVTLLIKA